ncbi:MAG: adenylate/guanylate cyclase domain-containing protein, partial [Bacillota bacterium]
DELLKAPAVPHPGGQRRDVTVLMADLCAFTALAEQQPPEAVLETLNAYLEALAGPVLEAGGTLDKYLGDGVMAIFGAPLGDPNHARKALVCAREMWRRVEALNRARRARGLPVLDVRAGVHSGEAVLGNIGTPQRMDYTAIGDAVNVCSRLQTEAAPGEILVTRQALQAAGGLFPGPAEVVGPEPVAIRGRRDRVEAFRVRPSALSDRDLRVV